MKDVTELTWDYGIGITQNESIAEGTTQKSITYDYTTAGTKLPILILTDDGTCGSFSYIREDLGRINTSTPPVVNFSKSSGNNICENVEFQFSDLSTLTDNRYQIVSWSWDFDEDGIEDSNEQHPKFTYVTAGTYDVTLTVATDFGCTATLTKADFVTVVSPDNLTNVLISTLEAVDQNHKVCPGESVKFTGAATTSNGDGSISSYHWDFGDGLESNSQIQSHVFGAGDAGTTNTVTLTVTDNSQCVKSTTVDIGIYKVEADFSIASTPVLRGNAIDFTDLATSKINDANDGTINTWLWTFENGTPGAATIQNPAITYNTIGSGFEVTLTTKNNEECADQITKTVDVLNNPPVVNDFTVTGNEDTDIAILLSNFDSHFKTSLDPMQKLEKVKVVSLPGNGKLLNSTVEISVGDEINRSDLLDLKFRPDANWNGSTTFDYNAYDGYDYANADATITINVTQVQDIPVISDITLSNNKDEVTSFDLVTFEDKFTDADLVGNFNPDFQKIKITALPLVSMGTLKLGITDVILNQEILKADLGNLVFEPALGFVGVVTFDWNASDGADYAVADAQVSINYYNRKPVLSSRKIKNVKENKPVSITQLMLEQKYSDEDKYDEPFKKIKITSLPSALTALFTLDGIQLNIDDEIDYSALNAKSIICQPVNPNFNGQLTFRWNAFDGTEYSDNDTSIKIWYKNTPPVVYDFSKTAVDEDNQVTFISSDFSTEDSPFFDIDSHDVLTQIKINTLPSNGTLKLNGGNVAVNDVILLSDLNNLTYNPKPDYNGTDHFQWFGYDGDNYSASPARVNLTINPIQDKPTVSDITKLPAIEDDNVQILKNDFIANFSDVDAPYGNPNSELFEIKIISLPNPLHGTLKLNGVNIAINDVILVGNIDTGLGLEFDPVDGYEGNSSFDWNGSDGLDYADSDATVFITHNNTAPVVSDHDFGNKLEDIVVTIARVNFESQYSDNDATDSQFEKVNIISLPNASIGKFQLNSVNLTTGKYTYAQLLNGLVFTPSAGANGTVNLEWNAYDGTEYAANSATFSFTYINSVPTVSDFSKAAVNEDNDVVFATTDFTDISLGNYSDVDVHDTFGKIKVTDTPDHGILKYGSTTVTLDAEVPYSELGNLIYQPDQHWFGSDSFKWTGHDGKDYSSESTVSLTVNSVNDAPIANNESVTTLEDQTHDFTAAEFSNSYSDDYFSENSAFAGIKIVGLETAGYLKVGVSDVTLNQALDLTDIANLTFSTDPHENGTAYATFGFKVYDGENYSTSVYTMTVNVTPLNDIPTFALTADPDVSIDEDHGLYESNNHANSMSEGPANESSQTLNFNVLNNNNSLFSVQPAIDNNGKLTFTTAANKFGTATVTVVLKDNGGTDNGGVDTSISETFTITIKAVNDHPVADNEAVSTNEDITYTFAASDFSDSYSDIENEPMNRIQITEIESVGDLEYNNTDVTNNLEINAADIPKLKFIPNPDQHASSYSSFKFKVYDGADYSDLEYTMTVNVLSVNDEPSFTFKASKNVVVDEDNGPATVNGQIATQYEGAANESSQDVTLHVSHTNSGLFTINPTIDAVGTLTFTPTPNAFGTSTVTVYITDNGGTANGGDDESDPEQFTITVKSVNDIPTASNEEVTELEDVTYIFAASDFSSSYADVETAFAGIEITGLENIGNLEYDGNPVATGLEIASADISKLKFIPNANENSNNY
ncbi:MAG: tandem-95 repeat protein, partial [Marinifilum sp.]|nr:tandem-95 repeat protein [Marinifilum sp.]